MTPADSLTESTTEHEVAALPGTPPQPPEPGVRGERVLVAGDRLLAWCDGWVNRWLPAECNPLAQPGRAANFALLLAVVSGVALLLWYSPSVQTAYTSIAGVQGRTLGGWVRSMHRYSSDLVMVLLVVHAGRMFVSRKFAGARWLAWMSGIGLLGIVWFIGWTGYWLVWDQPAQQVAVTSMRLLDALPIFGEPMSRLFVADRLVPSLLFFVVFFLHMLLPLAMALGLAVHVLRLSRVRLLPGWPLAVAMIVGVALAALVVPAPLDEPARMALKPRHLTVDTWYLWPLALGLRFQEAGLWLALAGTAAVGAAVPWIFGRRRKPVTFQAEVEVSRCHACTQCVQDCPFDAITMVPRTDGKRFPSQAQVDPARCVGCGVCAGSCDSEGIGLTWFDTRTEEARIEAEVASVLATGGSRWVAFVAGDIDSGLALFELTRWRERLPGYQVHHVPTASWVRPKLVERLLKSGVAGVLVVRDARAEPLARDGGRWVGERLAGLREPMFRPQRAGGSQAWCVLDYDSSQPGALERAAAEFQERARPHASVRPRRWRIAMGAAGLAGVLGAVVVAPSHLRVDNPAPAEPEFVFSFKAFGEMGQTDALDPEQEATKPVHMRGRATGKPQRAPVRVRVTIDGKTEEASYRAKGISRDGPALDQWRRLMTPGEHGVTIEIVRGDNTPAETWSGVIVAETGQLHVITYEPTIGFCIE